MAELSVQYGDELETVTGLLGNNPSTAMEDLARIRYQELVEAGQGGLSLGAPDASGAVSVAETSEGALSEVEG